MWVCRPPPLGKGRQPRLEFREGSFGGEREDDGSVLLAHDLDFRRDPPKLRRIERRAQFKLDQPSIVESADVLCCASAGRLQALPQVCAERSPIRRLRYAETRRAFSALIDRLLAQEPQMRVRLRHGRSLPTRS